MSKQDNNIYITVGGKTKLFAKAPEVLKNECDIELARELNKTAGSLRADLDSGDAITAEDLWHVVKLLSKAANTILRLSGYEFNTKGYWYD